MSRADWNQYAGADTNHLLVDGTVYEGSSSLKIDDGTVTSHEILAQSEADAPTDGRITTMLWQYDSTDPARELPCNYYRFQDAQNYYVTTGYSNNNNDLTLVFAKEVNGTTTVLGDSPASTAYSSSTWVKIRSTLWTDEGGDVRCRWELYDDTGGTWTALDTDMIDTTPDLSDGGGIGVGGHATHRGYYFRSYLDATEVYY